MIQYENRLHEQPFRQIFDPLSAENVHERDVEKPKLLFQFSVVRPDNQSAYFSLIEMSKGLLISQPGTQSETFWLFPIIEKVNLCSTTLSK